MKSRSLFESAALTASILATSASAQSDQAAPAEPPPILLPSPTGAYPVGKTLWHWPDPSRPDDMTPEPGDVRELVVKAWYPAEVPADEIDRDNLPLYAPMSRAYERVRDEAIPGARLAEIGSSVPVVILCPGRGAAAYSYTALAEDLASHGYAVFAFDAPHTGFVRYPDGREIQPSDAFQIPIEILTGPYEHADAFFEPAEKLGKADFDFVVRRIEALNSKDPSGRFTNKLDLSRMGAIAHSMGGRACGAGVHPDRRFKALASADGVPPRAARYAGFDQAVLMLVSGEMPDMALPNFLSVIPERRNDVYIAKFPNAEHNSIRDRPYLGAEEIQRAAPARQLAAIRTIIQRFFDRYVKGEDDRVAIASPLASEVTIETHPAPMNR